jgi:hypothetical protein
MPEEDSRQKCLMKLTWSIDDETGVNGAQTSMFEPLPATI